jgi:hypothetical protein
VGQIPPFHSGLAIWNQARIKVRISQKDELSREKVREGQRRSRILGVASYGQTYSSDTT